MGKKVLLRIEKLEKECFVCIPTGVIAERIASGAYYDELTDEEKNEYCAYRECERQVLEEVNSLVLGNLHFQIERKPKSPTVEEFRENVREVEAIMNKLTDEYNAPEERKKREVEYMEWKKGERYERKYNETT